MIICDSCGSAIPIVTELGAIPTTQYSVMGGGCFFPMVSREVSRIIINLPVATATLDSDRYSLHVHCLIYTQS